MFLSNFYRFLHIVCMCKLHVTPSKLWKFPTKLCSYIINPSGMYCLLYFKDHFIILFHNGWPLLFTILETARDSECLSVSISCHSLHVHGFSLHLSCSILISTYVLQVIKTQYPLKLHVVPPPLYGAPFGILLSWRYLTVSVML